MTQPSFRDRNRRLDITNIVSRPLEVEERKVYVLCTRPDFNRAPPKFIEELKECIHGLNWSSQKVLQSEGGFKQPFPNSSPCEEQFMSLLLKFKKELLFLWEEEYAELIKTERETPLTEGATMMNEAQENKLLAALGEVVNVGKETADGKLSLLKEYIHELLADPIKAPLKLIQDISTVPLTVGHNFIKLCTDSVFVRKLVAAIGIGYLVSKVSLIKDLIKTAFNYLEDGSFLKGLLAEVYKVLKVIPNTIDSVVGYILEIAGTIWDWLSDKLTWGKDALLRAIGIKVAKEEDIESYSRVIKSTTE